MKTILLAMTLASAAVGAEPALDEVNAARAARGLPAYVEDKALTAGAKACADFRMANRIQGHTGNDFAFLPAGTSADAAGAGALTPDWGFAACCMWDSYQYAGAAKVMGSDGRQYCSVFVRGGSSSTMAMPMPSNGGMSYARPRGRRR